MSVFVANHSYFLTLCPLPVTCLYLSFWHQCLLFLPPSLFLTLQLSPLISLALRISHHHSLLFSLSVGDRVKCRCSPNSPVTGSHLLLPPEYIWNHWLQRSQSKSNLSYKGNAFKLKGLCGGSDLCVFFFLFSCCACPLSPLFCIVAVVQLVYWLFDLAAWPLAFADLCCFLPFRRPEHEKPSGDLHHPESPTASGDVCGHGGRGSGALLPTDPPHFQHLQKHEQWVAAMHVGRWCVSVTCLCTFVKQSLCVLVPLCYKSVFVLALLLHQWIERARERHWEVFMSSM